MLILISTYYTQKILSAMDGTELCEVSEPVFQALEKGRKLERAQAERDRRHRLVAYVEFFTEESASMKSPAVISAEDAMLRQLEIDQLHAALAMLPKAQGQRIYAYFVLGYSMTEIARLQGVSIARVSQSIQRGLENLRRMMKS